MPGDTRSTAIAAIEAQRNELQTLAQGALVGERRAALARLAMIGMFGGITQIPQVVGHTVDSPAQRVVGIGYFLFAAATWLVLRRIESTDVRRSIVFPLLFTAVDFGFVAALSSLDPKPFSAGNLAVACGLLILFSVARLSLLHVVAAVAAAVATLLGVSAAKGSLGPTTVFVGGGFVIIGFMVGLTNRAVRAMFRDLRRRDNLTRFLPRQVAERVLAAGPGALAPVQRVVTVLFSDIRGFTAMSEQLEPRAVMALLDDYFGRMAQVVKGHDGVIGKFIGDGMLAYWGVPDRVGDHALRAVRAAADMRRSLAEINRRRADHDEPPLRFGVGIHTGTVAAGTLGGSLQSEYTVIGDAVNVAARIEQLTKEHDCDVLVSETTWKALGGAVAGARVATAELRGRSEPVVLYRIDDPS